LVQGTEVVVAGVWAMAPAVNLQASLAVVGVACDVSPAVSLALTIALSLALVSA